MQNTLYQMLRIIQYRSDPFKLKGMCHILVDIK